MITRAQAVLSLLFVTAALGPSLSAQVNRVPAQRSLALQCFDKPFVGLFARTKARDTFPSLEMSVTDPLGRVKGQGTIDSKAIPNSRYGQTIQLPSHPERSRAIGLEICDAEQGIYQLTVKERGATPYVLDLTVRGKDPEQGSESLLLHHIPQEGRILRYRFRYKVEQGHVVVRWLDNQGIEKMEVEPNDW